MKYRLHWNKYKYFPYEHEFALKELENLLDASILSIEKDSVLIEIDNIDNLNEKFNKLTYFSSVESEEEIITPTQVRLEQVESNIRNSRQATRYSAHGLHEYKGKFNPQVVKSILNIFNIGQGSNVLDPFSGSGTTLLECSFQNVNAIGLDINPLAVNIANAKQTAISTPVSELKLKSDTILEFYRNYTIDYEIPTELTAREEYLLKWFPEKIFCEIEYLRKIIKEMADNLKNVFYILLSDLIRDYSLQEPADLRIRRRKSPFPEESLIDAYEKKIQKFIQNIEISQEILGVDLKKNYAINIDCKSLNSEEHILETNFFDFGITSPPYATALPYIDTQRLSLVWMDLIPPDRIMSLESSLIGSREFKKSIQREWEQRMENNSSDIPNDVYEFCIMLLNSIGEDDGFRRQAVPFLLYRYFADMQLMFSNLLPYFKSEAIYTLIVGHNHTTLGGKRIDIDTPKLLVKVAENVGWEYEKSVELQTYKRYGINKKNAVNNETLIILRKP